MSWQMLLNIKICSFPWLRSAYIRQFAYVTFGHHSLTETNIFVKIEISLKNDFLFFIGEDAYFHFCLFI